MLVKAKYYKEIEVIDDMTKEEIEHVHSTGMPPDRFDCMADDMDNVKPLQFKSWEFVDDTKTESKHHGSSLISDIHSLPDIRTKKKTDKLLKIVNILTAIIVALAIAIVSGIGERSLPVGLEAFVIYFIVLIGIAITVRWINKVNRAVKWVDKVNRFLKIDLTGGDNK